MKALLTICLLVITAASIASAQTRAETRDAERRLSDMGYWTGPIDGTFDAVTREALIAFQKYEGRPITGKLTLDELEALRTTTSPRAREVGYAHVEVDVDRQVLMIVDEEGGVRILPTSTGNDKEFPNEGQTSIAYTPRGRFLVYDKSVGWEKGPLGSVYYPNYISGGVAIHGARNVPTAPASHGCIRIPMFAAREVSKLMKLGTIVLVYDKISFVSARDWASNPKLKEAALLSNAFTDEDDYVDSTTPTKTTAATKPKSRSHRGD